MNVISFDCLECGFSNGNIRRIIHTTFWHSEGLDVCLGVNVTATNDPAAPNLKTEFIERRKSAREVVEPFGERTPSANVLNPLVFSTEELPASEQFVSWKQLMSPLYDIRLPDGVVPCSGFLATQKVWDLRGMLLIEQTMPAFSFERTVENVRLSPIDHWQISFLRSGRTWTGVDGRVADNMPGMTNIRSLGYPFRGRALAIEIVLLIIPIDHFSHLGGIPDASNNASVTGYRAKLLIDFVSTLLTGMNNVGFEELPSTRDSIRRIVFDTIVPLVRDNDTVKQSTSPALMTKARRFIQKNLMSRDLTPDALSKELAISRTHLYQLFEGSGGVLNYVRQKRLIAAHQMLSDPTGNPKIADISDLLGFETAANFTRAFSQHFGFSPSAVRKSISRSESGGYEKAGVHNSASFESLLKNLSSQHL